MSDKKTEPSAGDAPAEDGNPWDEDESARTVATASPMELPSNIPSPITNPPPAAAPKPQPVPAIGGPPRAGLSPPKKAGKQTMIGIAGPAPGAYAPPGMQAPPLAATPTSSPKPAAVAAPAPAMRAPAPAIPGRPPLGAPSSQRVPLPPPSQPRPLSARDEPRRDEPPRDEPEEQEDGPTMAVSADEMDAQAVASMRAEALARSPLGSSSAAGTGTHGGVDKDAETVGRAGPYVVEEDEGIDDEATRAVARDELVRRQDAHVVVGADALGDEATLAVAPGQVDLGPKGNEIAAALAETLGRRESSPDAPGFPPPPGPPAFGGPMPMSGHGASPQAPFGHGGGTAAMPASYRDGQGAPRGYDPMLPGQPPPPLSGGYPSSGHQQVHPPHGPAPNAPPPMFGAPPMMGAAPMQQPMQHQASPMPPWMQPAQGQLMQAAPPGNAPWHANKQLILLGVVGVVCLGIFVVGIYLFVTTQFN